MFQLNSELMIMTKIIIIEDHPLVAKGIKNLIEESGIAETADIAATITEAKKMMAKNEYNLALLDIGLPDGSGIDLCKTISYQYPQMKILVISSYKEYTCINRMLDNGAMGYILKNAMPEEILEGIKAVLNGEKYICFEMTDVLRKEAKNNIFLLPREIELLKLITEGYTNPEIAEILFLSPETIKSYRKNLLFKLNVKNTAQLVKMAIEKKLV